MYPVGCLISVKGMLNDSDIHAALESLVARDTILRTYFPQLPEMARPLQVVQDPGSVRWVTEDLSGLSTDERDVAADRLITGLQDERCDPEGYPLLTAAWLRHESDGGLLYLQLPAALADGRTMANLADRLTELMSEPGSGDGTGTPGGVQYVEYSAWRNARAGENSDSSAAGADYWEQHRWPGEDAEGRAGGAVLPDNARPGAFARKVLGPDIPDLLDREFDGGAEAALLAAWACVAGRLTGRQEVLVETLFDGRVLEELEGSLGPYTEQLPVTVNVSRDRTFEAVAAETATSLATHREWLEYAPRPRGAGGDFGFAYLAHPASWHHGAVTLTVQSLSDHFTCAGAFLQCRRAGDGLTVTVASAAGSKLMWAADELLDYFVTALESLAEFPWQKIDRIRLLSGERRQAVVDNLRAARTDQDESSLFPVLFSEQVARQPDALAVVFGNAYLSYSRLDRLTASVVSTLREAGVRRGDVVAVSLDRGPLALIALISILRAGAAFLAIDPEDPPARKGLLCADSGSVILITRSRLAEEEAAASPTRIVTLPDKLAPEAPGDGAIAQICGADAAYVCYTSGTSGAPNGVVVEHHSLANYLQWINRCVPREVSLPAVSRLTFDASLKQVLGPLVNGGHVWLVPDDVLADPRRLVAEIRMKIAAGWQVGFNGVPALWAALLDAVEAAPRDEAEIFCRGLRMVLLGGEALSEAAIARTEALLPSATLWNLYGPTEGTANASGGRVGGVDGVTIGRAIDNAQILVLDQYLEPVPAGVPGGLYIAGEGLARCYTGHPDLTAARFRPHPFSDAPDSRIFATGDMARYLPDGRVEFLGRDDLQVKVNGFRVELEGVEETLRRLPGIRDAAVAVKRASSGAAHLVGFLVVSPEDGVQISELRALLSRQLPEYSLPARFAEVPDLPRTTAGKLDRGALAQLGEDSMSQPDVGRERTLVEQELAGIWARLLRLESVDAEDDFFALGGHSLLTVELTTLVQEATGVALPAHAVFEAPTLREFAATVDAALTGEHWVGLPELVPVTREGELPLSFSQQRLLQLESLEPGGRRHNLLAARRITGVVDEAAVSDALTAIARRHEIFRTAFTADPVPSGQVVAGSVVVPFAVTDLRGSGADPEGELDLAGVQRRASHLLQESFMLDSPPLMRAELVRLADRDAVLIVVMHRLVGDGWSKAVLFREFAALYQAAITGDEAALPALPIQYADYAAFEQQTITEQVLEDQLAYWRHQLAGTSPLRVPTDFPRTKSPSHRGLTASRRLPSDLADSLRAISKAGASTLFMTTLAGFAFTLAHYSGQSDFVVVTPVTARRRTELEGLIGPFTNLLPLRLDLSGDPTFMDLLARMRSAALAAHARQDLPFERLAQDLLTGPGGSRQSQFEVMFNYAHAAEPEVRVGGNTVLREVDLEPGTSTHSLELGVSEQSGDLEVYLTVDQDLFSLATAERMLGHFQAILLSVGVKPDGRMSEHFRAARPEPTAGDLPSGDRVRAARSSIDRLFAARARTSSESEALAHASGAITYGDLDRRSNRLARFLLARRVGPGDLVALVMGPVPEFLEAMLAVVKLGAGFVPFDPLTSNEEVGRQIADCKPAVVLTLRKAAPRIEAAAITVICLDDVTAEIEACSSEPPPTAGRDPRHPACVIYRRNAPGVLISHANLMAATRERMSYYSDPAERTLVLDPHASERFLAGAFWTLCSGGCFYLAPPGLGREPGMVRQFIRDHQITHLMARPSLYTRLHGLPGPLESLQVVTVSGERLYGAQVERHFRRMPAVSLVNEYSRPEGGGWALAYECVAADGDLDVVPAGTMAASRDWRVLNRAWRQVPDQADGELFLSGPLISAAGYAGIGGAAVAERLLPDPFADQPGARMLRAGELATVQPDGSVILLGPVDEQVRMAGLSEHRVPAEQTEAELLRCEDVAEVAVVAAGNMSARGSLTAFVVASGAAGIDESRLEQRLRAVLPGHLVPSAIVGLADLPRLPDGTLDRASLPGGPQQGAQAGQQDSAGPADLATRLAAMWAEEFDLDRVDSGDDFFALGGHSVLAMHLLSRVEDEFGIPLPARSLLFEAPTVREFAALVERERLDSRPATSMRPIPRTEALPLSFGQTRMLIEDMLEPGSTRHCVVATWQIIGPIDEDAVRQSLTEIVRRHEVLRTGYHVAKGEPTLTISDEAALPLTVADMRGLAEDSWIPEVVRQVDLLTGQPFTLSRPPLLRAQLTRLADDVASVVVVLHHIVADGQSKRVLMAEFGSLYQAAIGGPPASLPDLALQYADFAAWERSAMSGTALKERLDYWCEQLAGVPELELPVDHPRPDVPTHGSLNSWRKLTPELTAKLHEVGVANETTPFMTMLAALAVLISRLTGQPDFIIGTPATTRRHTQVEGLIGFFVNTLPLRMDLSGDPSFRELLGRARMVTLAAFEHQDVPFEKVVEVLRPVRHATRSPLVQVILNSVPARPAETQLAAGVTLRPIDVDAVASLFEFSLLVMDAPDRAQFVLELDSDLFDAGTAERLMDDLEAVVAHLTAAPEQPVSALMLPERGEPQAADGEATAGARPASRDDLHELLVAIWEEVFELDGIGIHDDFFVLGGHSLLALHVLASIEDALGVMVPLAALFERRTISELAVVVETLLGETPGSAQ
jgi:amino acid adenylation domain-containing protein